MVVSPGLVAACEASSPDPNNCGSFEGLAGAAAKVVPASVTGSTAVSPVHYVTNTLEGSDFEARLADTVKLERPGFRGALGTSTVTASVAVLGSSGRSG